MTNIISSASALKSLWQQAGLPQDALSRVDIAEQSQLLPSSFAIGVAAQASIAAAALSAEGIYHARSGEHQHIEVDRAAAERECTGYFVLDGKPPNAWEKFSGLYETLDGFVRIHANFDHHRDGVLRLLGLEPSDRLEREDVASALKQWLAGVFETEAANAGLVVAKVRSLDEWDQHSHALATHDLPVMSISKIGEAPPRALSPIDENQRPLAGLRVLDLTRILAGPICGRTLAAYGADVLLVNAPYLPNIASITDTSRGKRSAHLDLKTPNGRDTLHRLVKSTDIFVQGYRPQSIGQLGFSPDALAEAAPGIVYVSLTAYGNSGPWAGRRGFDSLVQSACGFTRAEAQEAQADLPKSLPVPIFDYASGFLMAFGAQAARLRQSREGGSWHVEVSLLQTANWIRSLGRLPIGPAINLSDIDDHLGEFPCDHGVLRGMPHAAVFSRTPPAWALPSVRPGTHPPEWLGVRNTPRRLTPST